MLWQGKKVYLLGLMVAALVACGDDDGTSGTGGGDMTTLDMEPAVDMDAPDLPERTVPCQDESISALDLRDTIGMRDILEEAPAPNFEHFIDARGGGFPPSESYVYARFTDEGLERVELDDEAALESTGWDIAFRRFVMRLNSGVAGPSYVVAARTAAETAFDDVTAVPDGLTFREEAYMSDTCEFVSDGSGIGAPATALGSFWTYPGCVSMTGNVFVVQLASGRHLKLQVLSYYSPSSQAVCDSEGRGDPATSANVRIRWAFLD